MSTLRSRSPALLLATLAAAAPGCTTIDTERRDWSGYDGPGAEYFHRSELSRISNMGDPAEPMNRFFSIVNHGFLVGFIDPLTKGYRFLVPEPGRRAIGRLKDNLAWPKRLVNNMLQNEWADAGTETARFLINTTIGIVGLFDVATYFGIEGEDEETAETFQQWGWEADTYLVLPILGPGSERDTPASFFDMALDPASYIIGLSQVLKFNEGSDEIEDYKRFVRTNYDPYAFSRYLWDLNRRSKFRDFDYTPEASSQAETLSAVFLEFQDADFPDEVDDDEVEIPGTGEELPFSYVMQEEPAPVLYILPGLGGHRDSESSLGLMEMAHKAGFSAVAISSAMNFEFMQRAATVAVPGYGPADAADVHTALDQVHKWLEEEYPGRIRGKALLGLSLGGYHALEIAAAAEQPANRLLRFDRYLAINPPVSLIRGVEQLDAYFNAPLEWPVEHRELMVKNALMKVFKLMNGEPDPENGVPVNGIEARFLIGLTYRLALLFVIHDSQTRNDMGVLLTDLSGPSRGPAYEEIFDYSYMEYIYAFVLPYFQGRAKEIRTSEDLVRLSDLQAIQERLAKCDKVRVFTNANDFLLDERDHEFLAQTFGPRLTVFPNGGHLGNLHRGEVQEQIMAAAKDLLPGAR